MSQAMNPSTRRIHSLDDCEPFTMQLHPAVSRIIKSYWTPPLSDACRALFPSVKLLTCARARQKRSRHIICNDSDLLPQTCMR